MTRFATAVPAHPLASFLQRRFRSFEERLGILGFALMMLVALTETMVAHEFKQGDLHIDHPWSREIPAGAKVAAGYFVVRNSGSAPDRLVAVESPIAGRSEIHEMSVNAEGVMTMRPVAGGLEVPAGGEVALKPGSFHVMFLELRQAPEAGVKFPGVLTFEKAGKVPVEFAVEPRAGAEGHEAHH